MGRQCRRRYRRGRGERGDVSNWLVQMLVVLSIVGLVAYEAVALGITAVSVDDAAREVARAARDEYRAEASLDRAEAVAERVADTHGAVVVAVDIDEDELTVRLEKRARTVLVHRIGPLADRVTPTATRRADLRP